MQSVASSNHLLLRQSIPYFNRDYFHLLYLRELLSYLKNTSFSFLLKFNIKLKIIVRSRQVVRNRFGDSASPKLMSKKQPQL